MLRPNWVSTNYLIFFTSGSGLWRKRAKHDSGSATKGSTRHSREAPPRVAEPESCFARLHQSGKPPQAYTLHNTYRAGSCHDTVHEAVAVLELESIATLHQNTVTRKTTHSPAPKASYLTSSNRRSNRRSHQKRKQHVLPLTNSNERAERRVHRSTEAGRTRNVHSRSLGARCN